MFNLVRANPKKWSNTLKVSLIVFDHFVGLVFKGLNLLLGSCSAVAVDVPSFSVDLTGKTFNLNY